MGIDTSIFLALNGLAGVSIAFDAFIILCAENIPYLLGLLFIIIVGLAQDGLGTRMKVLVYAGISAALARYGIVQALNLLYFRDRPYVALHLNPLVYTTSSSFPSGHAAFFFALSTVMYYYNRKWGAIFFLASFIIAVARVIAGVHYPSDIVVGALAGWVCAWIVSSRAVRKLRA